MRMPCRNCGTVNADGRPHECVSSLPARRKVRRTHTTVSELKQTLLNMQDDISDLLCELANNDRIDGNGINLDRLFTHAEELSDIVPLKVVG